MNIKNAILSRFSFILLVLIIGAVLTACSGSIIPSFELLPAESSDPAPGAGIGTVIPGVSEETLTLYGSNCASCHGTVGAGSAFAPALNSPVLRSRLDDDALMAAIANGRPGTAMPAWNGRLSDEQITSLVTLIRNWGALDAAQLTQMEAQSPATDCGGMGMGRGHGPMMGRSGCGPGMSGSWWRGNRP
jgi:cytochrome c553